MTAFSDVIMDEDIFFERDAVPSAHVHPKYGVHN